MINFFSSWAKNIGVTVVIMSIFEMLLPNSNSKKYIRMVLGIYLIFNIISPLIKNKEIFDINNIDLNETTISTANQEIDQTSMNKRIKKLYEQELEKDIVKKIEEKGYIISECNATTQISSNENEETKINKIKVYIDGKKETKDSNENTEKRIINEIQKIKKVETKSKDSNENKTENNNITKTDIENIKTFLSNEYGVDKKCLEIN